MTEKKQEVFSYDNEITSDIEPRVLSAALFLHVSPSFHSLITATPSSPFFVSARRAQQPSPPGTVAASLSYKENTLFICRQ